MSNKIIKRRTSEEQQISSTTPVDSGEWTKMNEDTLKSIKHEEKDSPDSPSPPKKFKPADDYEDSEKEEGEITDSDIDDFLASGSDFSFRSSATSTTEEDWDDDEDDALFPPILEINFNGSTLICEY